MKRVIVTGASTGFGEQVAYLCAERGHSLVLVARTADRLENVAESCRTRGAAGVCVLARDVSNPEAPADIAAALAQLGQGEPVLVSNAGLFVPGAYADTPFEEHLRQINVNLVGAMAVTHAVLPHMVRHGSGQIIQVASVAARLVFPGIAAYSASKAGMLQFGKCISTEYRAQGIRLTTILPGAADTEIWHGADHPPKDQMLTGLSVAQAIMGIVDLPPDRVIEELTITPPLGIL